MNGVEEVYACSEASAMVSLLDLGRNQAAFTTVQPRLRAVASIDPSTWRRKAMRRRTGGVCLAMHRKSWQWLNRAERDVLLKRSRPANVGLIWVEGKQRFGVRTLHPVGHEWRLRLGSRGELRHAVLPVAHCGRWQASRG